MEILLLLEVNQNLDCMFMYESSDGQTKATKYIISLLCGSYSQLASHTKNNNEWIFFAEYQYVYLGL